MRLGGLPIAFALAHPKTEQREVLRDLLEGAPDLLGDRSGQVILADKGDRSAELEVFLNENGARLTRPTMKGEASRPGAQFLKPFRQISESVTRP
ncbi:MAG: hypothetical protein M0004_14130 [Actinomycetota bacterium]|nr:hypothetical protein [Actinomycetota bacterium]